MSTNKLRVAIIKIRTYTRRKFPWGVRWRIEIREKKEGKKEMRIVLEDECCIRRFVGCVYS